MLSILSRRSAFINDFIVSPDWALFETAIPGFKNTGSNCPQLTSPPPSRSVTVESPALARQAFKAARANGGGFADQLIAQVSFANGANQVITFDEKFARSAKVRLLR